MKDKIVNMIVTTNIALLNKHSGLLKVPAFYYRKFTSNINYGTKYNINKPVFRDQESSQPITQ